MFNVKIADSFIEKVKQIKGNINLGKRNTFNGSKDQQLAGAIGELAVKQLLGLPLELESTFDGGYDVEAGRHKVDVKTRVRYFLPDETNDHDVPRQQLKYDSTGYIFCSYNPRDQILTICGAISKDNFIQWAEYRRSGERHNGAYYRNPAYNISYSNCKYISSREDLERLYEMMVEGEVISFY